jgi:hypothetical protein
MNPFRNILSRVLGVGIMVHGLQMSAATPSEPPPATPALVRVSAVWNNPGIALIGLPALRGSQVQFAADEAVYEGPLSGVRPVVKSSTYIPDTVDMFTFFEKDHERLNYDLIGGDDLTFVGRGPRGDIGIYRVVTNRVVRSWIRPGVVVAPLEKLERLRYPHCQGGRLVFVGTSTSGRRGVYRANSEGAVEVVADTTINAPGTENRFRDFSYARVQPDGTVLFTGYSESGSGIYIARPGQSPARLVDRESTEPRSGRKYAGALLVGAEEGWAYFTSFGTTLSIGRARLDGSTVETLVADDLVPSAYTERIGAINYASVDHGRVLFEAATHAADFDVYLWEAGKIRAVVKHGDSLEGGKVTSVRIGLQALSGNRFTCLIDTGRPEDPTTFQRAVYVGDLSPGAGTHLSLLPSKAVQSGGILPWLKLGRSPMPVFAREPSAPEPPPTRP